MIYLSILEKLPKKLAHSLIRFAPPSFQSKERIVRHIYTPLNININTRQLKPNFLQFRFNEKTRKNELSCNRLEFDSLKNLRAIGIKNERPSTKANYYGLACTNVNLILSVNSNYTINFTPIFDSIPINFTHCDIHDNGNDPIKNGEPLSSKMSLEREIFIKKWNAFIDESKFITKDLISSPKI